MPTNHHAFPLDIQRRTLHAAVVLALPLLAAPALAQDQPESKVAPAPRRVDDVKPAWTAPAKLEPAPAVSSTPWVPKPPKAPAGPEGFRAPSLADRVLFDEPGDGALWARGGSSYKARFDAQGATYFPRFGAETPRHYPVSFRLDEVQVGGRPLALDRGASYERAGSMVSYDRGALVELYELRPDGMEQLFHFDRLPAVGELVVRIGLETELQLFSSAAGFELSNEHGRVGYSRAVVLDARGRRQDVSTTFDDGRIEIRVPAAFLGQAAFPVTIDPLVATFDISQDFDADATLPDVAFDETTDRYTVVWEEIFNGSDHDVYSVLLAADGSLVPNSEVTIDFTTACWRNPKVANNQIANQFLVVAQTSPDCISSSTVEGRTREAAGVATGLPFDISGDLAGSCVFPDVGGDPLSVAPTYYCVVWQRELSPTESDIHYQMVRTAGAILNPTTQLLDNTSLTLDRFPSISKSNGQGPFQSQQWNVVWQRRFTDVDEDIRGAQIHWNGDITTPSFSVDFSVANDKRPQASTLLDGGAGPREYLVVYDRGGDAPRDIQATAFRGDTPLTESTNLSQLEGVDVGEDQLFPAVDSDGSCFAVVYQESFNGDIYDHDVYISTFDLAIGAGTLVPNEVHQALAISPDGEFHPQITSKESATDGTNAQTRRFMAAWWDHDFPGTSDGDIEGAFYDSLCGPGVAFCFGDGSAAGCPCGNQGGAGEGCGNSTGAGAALSGTGSNDVSLGNLVLHVTNALPGQPGLFFQGDSALASGNGLAFGDGLRCCGTNVIRLQVALPDGAGSASSSVDVAATGGVSAGDTKCYQFWYRNPAGSPCGSSFNLTNGWEATWSD